MWLITTFLTFTSVNIQKLQNSQTALEFSSAVQIVFCHFKLNGIE